MLPSLITNNICICVDVFNSIMGNSPYTTYTCTWQGTLMCVCVL